MATEPEEPDRFQQIFKTANPLPFESSIPILMGLYSGLDEEFCHAATILEKAHIKPKRVLGGGNFAAVMDMEGIRKSVVRVGKDMPSPSAAILPSIAYTQRPVPSTDGTFAVMRTTLTLRAEGYPDPYDTPELELSEDEKKRERGKDMDITLRFIKTEGGSSLADSPTPEGFTYLRNPDGSFIRYPEQGVPEVCAGRPIMFLQDMNTIQPANGEHTTGIDTHEMDVIKYLKKAGARDGNDNRPLVPFEPQYMEKLEQAFRQAGPLVETAREELIAKGVNLAAFQYVKGTDTEKYASLVARAFHTLESPNTEPTNAEIGKRATKIVEAERAITRKAIQSQLPENTGYADYLRRSSAPTTGPTTPRRR